MENNLEDIFKNKFTDYRPEVPANIWEKINTTFHNLILKRIITIISISLILASSFIYYFATINKKDIKEIKKIANSTYTISKSRSIKISQTHTHKENIIVKNKDILIPKNKNVIHITVNKKSEPKNKEKISYKNVQKKDTNTDTIETFSLSRKQGCSPLDIIISDNINQIENIKWEINGKEYLNKNKIEITFNKAGIYPISLIRKINGKEIIFTDSVTVFQKAHADMIIPAKIQVGKQIVFENKSQDADSYQWFINGNLISNAENLVYNFYTEGKIKLTLVATNKNNCTDTAEKTITVEKQKEYIIFPTAFSPNIYGSCNGYYNSDAKYTNEVFRPYIFDKKIEKYNLKIFNRRGKLIFETNKLNQGWDGYFENKLVPVDVYVYVAKGIFDDGSSFSKQGSITVIYNKN